METLVKLESRGFVLACAKAFLLAASILVFIVTHAAITMGFQIDHPSTQLSSLNILFIDSKPKSFQTVELKV